ncbi:MAG TPA: DUF6152 family protein [Gammaproteobacteria bacterium]|jgi:hypothetical protein|nr:DUF6152 family protein [Gammaproteobacteria bacterium]
MKRWAIALAALTVTSAALAHHGFGNIDATKNVTLEGTLTGIDFVNPHAYLYFDSVGADGKTLKMRCEMRAATVLRRSGWSPEMFVPGKHVTVNGHPNRADPASCYVEDLKIGDAPTLVRYQQLTSNAGAANANRPLRRPSGEPNISGDWAQEQYLLAKLPKGPGALVPKSMLAAVEAGTVAVADVPSNGWAARPVTYTAAGQAASDALKKARPDDNPRARCEITSVLFDWVFDGPINRITQDADTITIEYGRGLKRTVYMKQASHPAGIKPTRGGHSIGKWEGDTLVVDTVGFAPGSLAGTVPNSDKLHIVERFTLDTKTLALHRDYVAEDPVYFASKYTGSDTVLPADAPFAADECKELTYRNYSQETQKK